MVLGRGIRLHPPMRKEEGVRKVVVVIKAQDRNGVYYLEMRAKGNTGRKGRRHKESVAAADVADQLNKWTQELEQELDDQPTVA